MISFIIAYCSGDRGDRVVDLSPRTRGGSCDRVADVRPLDEDKTSVCGWSSSGGVYDGTATGFITAVAPVVLFPAGSAAAATHSRSSAGADDAVAAGGYIDSYKPACYCVIGLASHDAQLACHPSSSNISPDAMRLPWLTTSPPVERWTVASTEPQEVRRPEYRRVQEVDLGEYVCQTVRPYYIYTSHSGPAVAKIL